MFGLHYIGLEVAAWMRLFRNGSGGKQVQWMASEVNRTLERNFMGLRAANLSPWSKPHEHQ
jgi:hypothetical protein